MEITIRQCSLDDLKALQALSIETFNETFKDQNSPEVMQDYLDNAFSDDKLEQELSRTGSAFFLPWQMGSRRVI